MPKKIICLECKGEKYIEVLISAHDDKKEIIVCNVCKGKGYIYTMTDQEEEDYWENYW